MTILTAAGVRFAFVAVPAGRFVMGSPNTFYGEDPPHPVAVPAFLLGAYPVTQAQYAVVADSVPSHFAGDPDRPVESVRMADAVRFCDRLTALTGRRVRLPSEAEWEYACRAGTTGEFFFAPDVGFADDGDVPAGLRAALGEYAWYDRNSGGTTQPVGRKRANPWGLFDVVGNVWEWCGDTWHGDYAGAPSDGRAWAEGADVQPRRVVRGGAWDMNAFRCRSCYRSCDRFDTEDSRIGFRVAVEVG